MIHTAGEVAEYLSAEILGDARAPISGVANPEEREAGGSDLRGFAAPPRTSGGVGGALRAR